jgi:hypothetical protein
MDKKLFLGIIAVMLLATVGIAKANGSDTDGDGVPNTNDMCPGTVADGMTLGTNRWMWTSGPNFITNKPNGKGPKLSFTIEQTFGCSCAQILGWYKDEYGYQMEGHWKFGCSISVIQDFIRLVPC